jgi:hypothetical protein
MNITKRVDGNLTNSSIKRISLKNRNPKNAPTQSEAKILELFENLKSNSMELTPMVQKVSESEYKFFKPIVIKKGACLKCHGDDKSIDPKVKESLKKLYPEDKAVGYKLDDIRGAFVVDITIK